MKPSIIIDPIILNDNIKDLHLLLNTIIKENFFSVIEIWDTLEGSILDIIKSNSCHVIFDVNLSPLMSSMNYDLSSNDAEIRCRSLMHVYNRIELLRKYGVKCISLSAPSQNNIDRKKCLCKKQSKPFSRKPKCMWNPICWVPRAVCWAITQA